MQVLPIQIEFVSPELNQYRLLILSAEAVIEAKAFGLSAVAFASSINCCTFAVSV